MSTQIILRSHLSDLGEALEDIKFTRLCSELAKYRVIDAGLKEKLRSLDPDHLESDVKVRYLLHQVVELVQHDNKVFSRLIKALKNLKVGKVCDDMVRQLGDEEAGKETCVALTERDVPNLVEVLTCCSNSWDAIGMALGIPEHKREDCGEGKTNVNRLSNILTTWILGSYEGARPATLDALRCALASGAVSLGKSAQKLSHFKQCERELTKLARLDSQFDIEYQSCDTQVAEGKYTVLEIYVDSNESIQYKWQKDGHFLLDSADFSGVSSGMLYISNAIKEQEGKFSCMVTVGDKSIHSEEIALKVVYPSEKHHLVSRYSEVGSEIPQDSWPPVSNSTFINLVLIQQSPISQESYFTVRGDMDDIIENKEVVEYGEIFKEYKKSTLVLLEGRPGSGKTTLVHKITRDWAQDAKILQGAKMVFLLTLRLLNTSCHKDESLADILDVFYSDDSKKDDILKNLENNDGENSCFILDGLDEYKPRNKKKSMIYKLIEKKRLPFAMVIIASRPVAINELKHASSKRIEVIGFSSEQIYKYIEAYPFENSDTKLAQMLNEYLREHPNVLHMCYLPVHAAMICFLFGNLKDRMPSTETKIYEQFTISSILRQRRRKVEYIQLKDLQSLDAEDKTYVDNICKLAYNMTINSQQVVSKSDAHIPLSDDLQLDQPTLGLLTVERTSKWYGIDDKYSFLHLTFQEFLAAFHIAQQDEVTQSQILQKHSPSKEMKNVWKFFSGLCGHKMILKTMFSEDVEQSTLYRIQCAFESQDAEVCDSIIGSNCTFEFLGNYFTPNDFIALAYVLSKSSKVIKLSFKDCFLTIDGVSAFSSKVSQGCALKSLEFKYSHPKDDILKILNFLLHQFPYLQELTLSFDGLKKSSFTSLTENICLSRLKILKLTRPFTYFTKPEVVWKRLSFGSRSLKRIDYCQASPYASSRKGLCHVFASEGSSKEWICQYNSLAGVLVSKDMFSRGITEVILVNCGIGDQEAEVLASGIKPPILKFLNLDFNKIADSGAVALAGCLKECAEVLEISIQCNSISDSGAAALADAFMRCSKLKKINLQGNCFGDEGVIHLAKNWHYLLNSVMYLCNKNVTSKGIKKVLNNSNRIKVQQMVFESSWNIISSAGIDAFKSGLECGNLHEILLSDEETIHSIEQLTDTVKDSICGLTCTLTDSTIKGICQILASLSNVKQINISGICGISSEKVQLLVSFLQEKNSNSNVETIIMNNTDKHCGPIHSSLLSALKSCDKLQSLCLRGCKLSSESLNLLFSSSSWSVLSDLDLSYNEISFQGAIVLKKLLGQVCYLKLSHNNFGDEGAIELAKGLHDSSCLRELDLSYNAIHLKGIEMLCGAIIGCSGLRVLNLGANTAEYDGTKRLALVLQRTRIVHLDLSSCGISVRGMEVLKLNMSCNSVQTLVISGNMLGSAGIACLGKMLFHCKMLLEIDISDNSFGSHANYKKVKEQTHSNGSDEDEDQYGYLGEDWENRSNECSNDTGDEYSPDGSSIDDMMDDEYPCSEDSDNNRSADDMIDGNDSWDDNDKSADDMIDGNDSWDDNNRSADDMIDGNDSWDDNDRSADDMIDGNDSWDDNDMYGNEYQSDGSPYGYESENDLNSYCESESDGNPYSEDETELPDETSMQAIIDLAAGLRSCRYLQHLNISSNNLNAKDVALLMKRLKRCEKLEDLNVDKNFVESGGIREIMENCKHLTRLSLQNSHIDLDDVVAFMKGREESKLLQIFIGGYKIDEHERHLLNGESNCRICEKFLGIYSSSDYVNVSINGCLIPKRLIIN